MMHSPAQPLVRIAVVSDIHAFTTRERATDSVVDYTNSHRDIKNPLSDLIDSVGELQLKADVLVCPGDICNKADAGGLERAWADLQHLQRALGASNLVATCGNHDLDSRHLQDETDPDPKGAMLALSPSFPFNSAELTNQFWARNYAVVRLPSGIVMVTLNTSAYHGGKETEILHGRISKRTIAALAQELSAFRSAPAYVLICHHHPLPLSMSRVNDGEFIREGQQLLDALTSATCSSWLVVHGHRHHPRLLHGAAGSNYVPFIFGAGSLGARSPGITNQFHLLSLFCSTDNQFASINGTVETWSWTDSTRWAIMSGIGGLPPHCGFGYRGQIPTLAQQIATLVGDTFLSIDAIKESLPAVDFLTPESLTALEAELEKLGLHIMRGRHHQILQIGK